MKKQIRRLLTVLLTVFILVAAVGMISLYSRRFSERIYEESMGHLQEIYAQVNSSFLSFTEQNWGILNSWSDYIKNSSGKSGESRIAEFLKNQKQYWKFTDFYFVGKDGKCLKPNGAQDEIDVSDFPDGFFEGEGEPSLMAETMSDGQPATMFLLPGVSGKYRGFSYDAIAITYSNADLSKSLNVDAYSGKSSCFVIYEDGGILLSAQRGGGISGNYLSYLRKESDLTEQDLENLREDWENGESGSLRCEIDGVEQYISYQPMGYQGCTLLGIVPERVANHTFRQIQEGTIDVLVKVFLLIGIYIVLHLVYRNWSQSRKSKMELKYRELMFDLLSNNVDDIFLMLEDETWKVDYVSPNVEQMLGVPKDAVMKDARTLWGCLEDADGRITGADLTAIPVSGSKVWERKFINAKTGEYRWYRETAFHEEIAGVEKCVIVMSDRTQEQMMNQSLQEALDMAKSANEAKSHFLANMSHDIRTPMNAIVGFAALLEKDASQEAKVREYSRKISASSKHLLNLINDVLDMSKIESGKTSLNLEEFDLPELIEELNTILRPQAKAKGQDFKTHVRGKLTEQLVGDKLRLNQILLNLLSNAIKYTPDGGKIDFNIEELPKPSAKYVRMRFQVKDNGIGMSEEFLGSVFEPFAREASPATDHVQGTGLGMAITKNLVDLMGGTIQVDSKLGEGSTFTVEMSFAQPDTVREAPEWLRSKVRKALIVNSQEKVCRSVQESLRGAGIEASYAMEGEEALREVEDAHARGEDYQVVLMDCRLGGHDSLDVARQIRERLGESKPVLVMASHNWSDIEDEAWKAGVDAFMSKPFFLSTFWQAITPLFSESGEPGEDMPGDGRALDGMLFLVAEDVELNAEVLGELMKMEGASCEFAKNGREAVDLFNASEPGHYDMNLMDVQMPEMNGYEAARAIRASAHPDASRIRIVAMTANAFAEDVRRALDAGMDAHLSKPVDMDALKALIAKLS